MFSNNTIQEDLKKLGFVRGDVILIRADIGSIGRLETKKREDYLNCLLNVVGEEGTIIALSFTSSFFIKKNKQLIFDGTNKSYTGAFANLMLKNKSAIRSTHPTNSYVAIGKHAKEILSNHNVNSGAYEPMRKIIQLNGKMALIGCVESSPGFTTTHLAEVDLGLHKRIIFPWLNGCFYKFNNKIKLFRRKDLGSCSSTFYRFYSFYVKNKVLKQSFVGNAYSLSINAKDAYEIELKVLAKNPRITICDSKKCRLCRARRWDNLIDLPLYVLRNSPRILNKIKGILFAKN